MQITYKHTRYACYAGYITQAIINNLAPLLFIIFQTDFALSYEQLGSLVLLNFFTQLVVDALAARFVDGFGYRGPLVAAHAFSVLGLALLALLPGWMDNTYLALGIAVVVYAVGGGLLEVLVSPVVEALPTPEEEKASSMSLLHSFYCWGQVAVVLLTTLLLRLTGTGLWMLAPLLWAMVPLFNLFVFLRVPLAPTVSEEQRTKLSSLLRTPAFLAALILMACAGASELTVSQWSSLFAEQGLGLSKMWGDLAGPCMFAILMGVGRTIYGVWGTKIRLKPFMLFSALLCMGCYLVISLSASPVASLIACALCGFAVSIMWPGTFSLTAARFPLGGTAMFAVMALFGDLGGSVGPWLAGVVADRAEQSGFFHTLSLLLFYNDSAGLKMGILAASVFPLLMIFTLLFSKDEKGERGEKTGQGEAECG